MIENAFRAPWRRAAGPAFVLAVFVVGWEQMLHALRGVESAGPVLPHLLLDSLLAFPLAFFAVSISFQARRCRALIASSFFTVLLIPAVGMHEAIHSLFAPHPKLSPAVAHLVHERLAAQEHAGALVHGMRDALTAFPFALLIAALLFGSWRRLAWRRGATFLFATALVALPLPAHSSPVITPFNVALPIPPTLSGTDITLTAAQTDVQVLPGAPTKMWTYNGSFPGPTIVATAGQQTRVTVVNNLPADIDRPEITLHQHGEHARSIDDGQPASYLIPPGIGVTTEDSRMYTYDFTEGCTTCPERGAFQWYHDHRMDHTGRNIWMGLAGMVILKDPSKVSIDASLPNGARDVPLMVADRTFDDNNQIPYGAFNLEGRIGNATLVNGAPQPYFEVADAKYRFRILNASNTRSYDFALSDGAATVPMTQIATESGLLPAPATRSDILLGPAERAEVIVDFAGRSVGDTLVLQNLHTAGPNLSQVMQFRVTTHVSDDVGPVPATLRAEPSFGALPVVATRTWLFGRDQLDGHWTINGHGFDPNTVDAHPKLGTAERWVFINTSEVDHIVHIHDVDWHIESRSLGIPLEANGLTGEPGLRESFRLHPGEVVTVVSAFTDHTGIFVLHCHLLEHEDMAMMTQFEVVP
ncbi:MAG: multicopper oxidase family protein [Actinobacteria bacterium]|nr:multicopper oxidase family protein [Actinomycetota bacterium]